MHVSHNRRQDCWDQRIESHHAMKWISARCPSQHTAFIKQFRSDLLASKIPLHLKYNHPHVTEVKWMYLCILSNNYSIQKMYNYHWKQRLGPALLPRKVPHSMGFQISLHLACPMTCHSFLLSGPASTGWPWPYVVHGSAIRTLLEKSET